MKKKMSKSKSNEQSIDKIPDSVKIGALKDEVNYWKMRYKLLEKYGSSS